MLNHNITAFFAQHGMSVVPVIGFLPDKKAFIPAPNPAEVEEMFDAPIEMFLKVFMLSCFSTHQVFVSLS